MDEDGAGGKALPFPVLAAEASFAIVAGKPPLSMSSMCHCQLQLYLILNRVGHQWRHSGQHLLLPTLEYEGVQASSSRDRPSGIRVCDRSGCVNHIALSQRCHVS